MCFFFGHATLEIYTGQWSYRERDRNFTAFEQGRLGVMFIYGSESTGASLLGNKSIQVDGHKQRIRHPKFSRVRVSSFPTPPCMAVVRQSVYWDIKRGKRYMQVDGRKQRSHLQFTRV